MPLSRYQVTLFLVGLGMGASACRDDAPVVPPAVATAGSARPLVKPVDRLAPGELAEGEQAAFGFKAPRELKLNATFPDSAHFSGQVEPLALATYVRERVSTMRMEVADTRTTFEHARILAGDPKRTYRFDILAHNAVETRLIVHDITPPPSVVGLSEAERWSRAGMKANGELTDPLKQE